MGFGQYSKLGPWVAPKFTEAGDKNPEGGKPKHVLDTGTVPHAWAHPLEKDGSGFYQTHARNSQGNIFYKTLEDGTRVLYSYRNSYPIGSLFLVRKGKTTRRVYLTLGDKPYSVTTAGHMNMCRGAVPKDAIHWDVLEVVSDSYHKPTRAEHVKNVAFLAGEYAATVAKLTKAKSEWSINDELGRAIKQRRDALDYAKFFKIKTPKLAPVPTISSERRAKAQAFDAGSTVRRERIREAKRARWAAIYTEYEKQREQARENARATLPERIAKWRAGEHVSFYSDRLDYAMLRLAEEDGSPHVETTQGVKVLVSGLTGAARLFHFLKALYDAKREYTRNGHTQHIGNFTVDSFKVEEVTYLGFAPEPRYVLTSGCHKITWAEIEALAPAVLAAEAQGTTNLNPFGAGTPES
jgi:hypothetical protein